MNAADVPELPNEVLNHFSEEPREAIERLVKYFKSIELPDLSYLKASSFAAVLVLLYEQDGQLRVVLTTRSTKLRTHPGKTAFPGGKAEESDRNIVTTAYREANEEIGLPLDCPYIHTLGVLGPHIFHKLLVSPVVAILTQSSVLEGLKASEEEVDCIFTHPLKAILQPDLAKSEPLVPTGSSDWPFEEDYHHISDYVVSALWSTTYRSHHFRTSASNINGLTGDILIKIAEIALDEPPAYVRYGHDQVKDFPTLLDFWRRQNGL
ncbi:NUDIX hydrolase domain-like protein [Cyathus striatus]|nr:NUDIX hydrolase domain-like protein [Cyathus striatus]